MSTGLELRQDLPTIRVHPIKKTIIHQALQSSSNSASEDQSSGGMIRREDEVSNVERCRTPTSEEHKIPAVLGCPPAPRKPRVRSALCKRKLWKLEFFETVNGEEVESFFRSSFEVLAKRRCQKEEGRVN